MYFFKEIPSLGDLTEIRDRIAPLVSLARLLSVALTYEMLRGKKKRGRKASRATSAATFPAGGTPVFSFTIARTLLLLVCDSDNVACERGTPATSVYLSF